jgi:hypothetical protein
LTDIFHEVEEEVRRERLEQIWKQHGDYIIGGVSLVVIGIAAFLLWQRYELGQQQKASIEYDQAVQLAASDPASAISKLEELSKTAPSGYALLARFAEADALLANGERDKALDIYKAISTDNNPIIGNAARLRSAWAIVDTAPRDTVAGLVQPLDTPDSAWRFLARELIAYADYRSRDLTSAGKEYQSLADDSAAPATVRARAKAMASLIKAGGISEYGTVPPLKTTTPAPDAAPSP